MYAALSIFYPQWYGVVMEDGVLGRESSKRNVGGSREGASMAKIMPERTLAQVMRELGSYS